MKNRQASSSSWTGPTIAPWVQYVNIGKEYLEPDCDIWCKSAGIKMNDVMYIDINGVCSNNEEDDVECSILKTSENEISASLDSLLIAVDHLDLPYVEPISSIIVNPDSLNLIITNFLFQNSSISTDYFTNESPFQTIKIPVGSPASDF